jgi:hypothetical protein
MTAPEVLKKAKRLKISLWCEGAALKYEAPPDVLTDALRAEIRAHKPALLELLQHGDRYAQDTPATVAVARSPDNVMAQRVAAQWNATFTPEEIQEYNRAVFALDHGLCPEDTQP